MAEEKWAADVRALAKMLGVPPAEPDDMAGIFLDAAPGEKYGLVALVSAHIRMMAGRSPMPEPEPMSWEEADQWLSLGYDRPGPVVCRADLFRAIALGRREKERAEKAEEMLADLPNWEINYATLKDLADKLAEAVGKLPLTGGPVVDALRAYREAII